MIKVLQEHSVCSDERCIPPRVFGPTEYLDDPPKQLTKPQTTVRPLHDDNRSAFDAQPSHSRMGSFQGTRSPQEKYFPKFKEQSSGQKFSIWFDCTFVDWSAELRQKAIKASQEAATCVLFQAPRSPKEPILKPEQC